MPGQPYRVEVESVHWPSALPALHLFQSFRLAVHPAKLLLAYLLVALLYLGGHALDLAWGPRVVPGDYAQYLSRPTETYHRWQELHASSPRQGVFAATVEVQTAEFSRLVGSALSLDFGFGRLMTSGQADQGVVAAAWRMFVTVPGWLWHNHPIYLLIYAAFAFALVALFGGAISRLAAEHASRDLRQRPGRALRFARERFHWFVLAPVIPLAMALVLALIVMLAGGAFFNLPGLDIVGGLLYGLFLLLGLLVLLTLVCLALGGHLLYPAIAVENADAFDAISRAYNYVLGRPWRFLLYAVVAILFFAITYLLAALLLLGVIHVTREIASWLALAETTVTGPRGQAVEVSRFGAIHGHAWNPLAEGGPTGTAAASGWLVAFWIRALLLLLPAYAVSYYFSACTWIYLLLRLSADRVYFDDLHVDEPRPAAGTAVDEETVADDPSAAPADLTPDDGEAKEPQ